MQSASWIALLRRIPANLHDGMILSLTTGSEVVVQRFVKLDADVAILRGRMAGTQDNGRLVILPYNNFIAINFTRRLSDEEVEAIFGKNTQAFAAGMALSAASSGENEATEATKATENGANDAATGNDNADGSSVPAKPAMPSKTILIAKLRARLSEANKSAG
jgi:hypothetical protein